MLAWGSSTDRRPDFPADRYERYAALISQGVRPRERTVSTGRDAELGLETGVEGPTPLVTGLAWAHAERMKVTSRHTYSASPAAVFAAMTTPDVLIEKYTSLGHQDVKIVERTDLAGVVRVISRRKVPMEVPGFAKRFLNPLNTVEQTDEWQSATAKGERHGTWKVSATGVPVSVGGTLHLVASGKGRTVVEIIGDVSCSIPFLGGKLASYVGADVERTMRAEEAFNDSNLAGA